VDVGQELTMELGAFSVSSAVKDIEASRSFYEKFGFQIVAGDISETWLIMKNSEAMIGLFQGMFEKICCLSIPAGMEMPVNSAITRMYANYSAD